MTDSATKQALFSEIEKETGGSRRSIEAIFSKSIKNIASQKGLDPSTFQRAKSNKFNSSLSIKPNIEKKENVGKATGLTVQNPKMQSKDKDGNVLTPKPALEPIPMDSAAGVINTFIGSFLDDFPEMTTEEKKDMGVCLNMLFGEWLNEHGGARKIFGLVSCLGFWGSKVRQTRKANRLKENPQEQLKEDMKQKIIEINKAKVLEQQKQLQEQITPELKEQFDQQTQTYADQTVLLNQPAADPQQQQQQQTPATTKYYDERN